GNTIQIDVADTGLGISAEDQEKLFTRFFRAEDSAVRQQAGTGLGLSITKSLVEMHGGEIWVKSKIGKGTTTSFTLPLPAGLTTKAHTRLESSEPETPKPTLQPDKTAVSHNGSRIMIVEDDLEIAHLFQHNLQTAGYTVIIQSSSQNIIEVTKAVNPDLITLDLLMDVDGLSVLEMLKEAEETRDIPVVIISVVGEPEKGLALGAADYLTKPVDEKALLDSIGKIFEQLDKTKTGHTILVVDDDKDIANWLKHALVYYGFETTTAYDGLQCLEAVDNKLPDLILLDMSMPRMDGPTTIRKLREQAHTRHIPVIVLSANPPKEGEERAQLIGAGVKEFLKKPVPIENVIAEIEKHLHSIPDAS
ncbi:MAG: response regulator, partial [Candidatus Promineifilaceae bacterium]